MLSTLKSYVWGAVASLIALLSAALWWTAKSRDSAQRAAQDAERNAQAVQKQRDTERSITRAQSEARQEAAEHAESIQESQARGDRSHGLTNDRLRDD